MRMRLFCLTAVLAIGALMINTGCELEESCDPDTDPDCVVTTTDTTTTADTTDDTSDPGQSYHYLLIEDREDPSTSSPTHTAGVDIFGVQLTHSGGSPINASEIHACNFGSGDNAHATNCESALGTPIGQCSTSGTADYVALGGQGGNLIVSFGALEEIVVGDEITVHECGRAQNAGATDEEYDAFYGVSTDPNASTWVECLRSASGEGSCTVGSLPPVARN